ncbi:EAL domain-containing protein [Sulfurimonas sp. SAG-AH-194-C21]|nr:bifunctional diguanylate cyclase/phosphodiesterase [Sulfurimonas sp. SAG-AH-194-C21]MDF1883090.1 EAL domain-containing protein [Sulfurimonas sp. SAG-AH-194-C21]
MSLSFRIIFLLFVSISINSVVGLYTSLNQQEELNQTYEKIVVKTATQLLSDTLIRDIIENNILKVTNILKKVSLNDEIIEFIYVTDTQNRIFASTFVNGFPKYLLASKEREIDASNVTLLNKFQTKNHLIYEYKQTIISGLDSSIYIGINKSKFSNILSANMDNLIINIIVTTIILLILSIIVSRKSLEPLNSLTKLLQKNKNATQIDFSSINTDTIEIKQLVQTLSDTISSLGEKEKNLAVTLDSIGDAVIVTDNKGRIVRMNPVAENLTAYSLEEAKMKKMSEVFKIIDATTRESMFDPAQRVLTNGKVIYLHNHTTLIAKDKKEYQIADSAAPIFDENGAITGVIVVFQNVTEQYKLREKARGALEQLERIFQGVSTQVIILELDGTIVLTNNVLDFFNQEEEDIVGKVIWNLRNVIKNKHLYIKIQEFVKQAAMGIHSQIDTQNENQWLSLNFQPIKNSDGDIIQIVIETTDITQRKEAEAKIMYQANYDSLTGIANRSLALAQLEQTIKESHRNNTSVAVLFLDLDNFKNINDTLGHDAGDKVLIQVSKHLKKTLRDKDTIGRLGGDEFIIFLNDVTEAYDIQVVCNNIIKSFMQPMRIDDLEVIVTLSIGIALYPTDGKDVSELLINADIAMYDAKNNGKNSYSFFTAEMNSNIARQLSIENKIFHALKTGEFEVYYQPKIDIKTLKMVGLEALIRWTNKELGSVSPEEFIPIAEKSAHIINIGYFVIDEVAKTLHEWQGIIDKEFRVSINLSPIQFRDSGLINSITQTFKKYEISTGHIDFELTESAFIEQGMHIKEQLEALKKLGATISMDDFGTGYASLGYLKDYPFDIIKIDKSFIMNMEDSPQDKKLVLAIIAMAKSLELRIVAEGVETKEILASLREMECDYAQGYYFSKAVPKEIIYEQLNS